MVQTATKKSIEKGLKFAVMTMKSRNQTKPSNIIHKAAVMTSGATGGAFGLVALPVELPISTVIMLRSISDMNHFQSIAQRHFIIRRLERKYSADFIEKEYKKLDD